MWETHCVRIALHPGSLPRVRAWAAELTRRADEVLATLRDEGVVVESVFLDCAPDGDYLVYYMKGADLAHATAVVRRSAHVIDAYHQQFKQETWGARRSLELLVDFDRIGEVSGQAADEIGSGPLAPQ